MHKKIIEDDEFRWVNEEIDWVEISKSLLQMKTCNRNSPVSYNKKLFSGNQD